MIFKACSYYFSFVPGLLVSVMIGIVLGVLLGGGMLALVLACRRRLVLYIFIIIYSSFPDKISHQNPILVQVTIYRRLRTDRDGYLDQFEAYDIDRNLYENTEIYRPTASGVITQIMPCT